MLSENVTTNVALYDRLVFFLVLTLSNAVIYLIWNWCEPPFRKILYILPVKKWNIISIQGGSYSKHDIFMVH